MSGAKTRAGMGRYRAYPEYKESGVEWLGEVPGHWEVKPNGRLFRERDDRGFPDLPILNVSIHSGVSLREFSEERIEQQSQDRSVYKRVEAGAIAFNKMRMWQGAVGVALVDGLVSPDYTVAEPVEEIEARYCEHLFRTPFYKTEINRYSHGIVPDRNRLYWDDFKQIKSLVPPLGEQRAIVKWLDLQTAKIDALIQKKQRLIELLQEKRTALITHAVTKGLDPDVAMKESGVEWLGEIPEHWTSSIKLTQLALNQQHSFVNGPFGSDLLTSELMSEGVPVIYIRDFDNQQGYRRVSSVFVTPEKAHQLDFCRVDPGDVLIAKVGDPPGEAAVYPERAPSGIVTQDVIRLRLGNLAEAEFFALLLNSRIGSSLIDGIAVESTRRRVSLGDFKKLRVAIPPRTEQRQIVNWVHRHCRIIGQLSEKVAVAITHLKEYRTALISAAVTGKIDVRAEAA